MKTNTTHYVPLLTQMKDMYRQEGIRGYFRGQSCTLVGSFVCNGFYFFTYEHLKAFFRERNLLGAYSSPFVAAFFGGFACDLMYLPFDIVRVRMQLEPGEYHYKNVFNGLNEMWKHEGFSSVFRNCGPVYFAFSAVQTSLTFGFYELISRILRPLIHDNHEVNLPLAIISSVSAASLSSLISNPLDLLVTRKQSLKYEIGTLELIRNIYKTEGLKGFMKGATGTISYYAVASVIMFPTYEILKNMFHVDLNE